MNIEKLEMDFATAAKLLFKHGMSEAKLKGLLQISLDEAQEENTVAENSLTK